MVTELTAIRVMNPDRFHPACEKKEAHRTCMSPDLGCGGCKHDLGVSDTSAKASTKAEPSLAGGGYAVKNL
jgi:hypothetical protein